MTAQQLRPDLTQKASILGEKLIKRVNTTRSPVGLDAALGSSCRQEARNIWLDAGFQAWYAWFCIDNITQKALAELPDSDLREIARLVSSVKPDDTVQTLFWHLFHGAYRGASRRRKY